MKNKILILLISISLANAEKSGLFVGVEIGSNLIQRANSTSDKFLGSIGANVGYKQFFTRYIGLRYYGNLNMLFVENSNTTAKNYLTALNTSMNVDLLANVLSTKNVDFGGFVGFRFGGNILFQKVAVDFVGSFDPQHFNPIYYGLTQIAIQVPIMYVSDIEFDANFEIAFSSGLRINLEKHDACELFFVVPLFQTKPLDIYDSKHIYKNYTIGLRYTHSFATHNNRKSQKKHR